MQVKTFELNPLCVNTYLIYDETKEAVLIDCGASSQTETGKIKEYIDAHHLNLKRLLNTHLHFDHILGNRFVYDTYGLKPEYHTAESGMPGLELQAPSFGISIDYQPVTAGHFIGDGDRISFGNTVLTAIRTPGHSPGSLSFYCREDNSVFTGDALFRHSIGRTDLWGGDARTLITSIRTKLLTLPDHTKIFPGHGPASLINEEKNYNMYLFRG